VFTRLISPAVLLAALLACACGASSLSIDSPTASKCEVSAANSLDTVPAAGASGTIGVTTTRDCTWAASSGAQWVVITSPTSGQGSGSLAYRVAANRDPSPRKTTVEINDSRIEIAQEAGACRFSVSPTAVSAAGGGASQSIAIDVASESCAWTAASQAEWIHLSSSGASGSGSITISVDANGGAARMGSAIVAGQAVTVTQGAASAPAPPATPAPDPTPAPCTYAIGATGQTIAASGGSGTIAVTAGPTCGWTAASNAAWVTITAGASGIGNGAVQFSVAANSGGSRSGTITAAGRTFTVTQAAPSCSYTISPGTQTVTSDSASVPIAVSTGSACAWTASSNASWITVSSGASGTGGGTVGLTIAANTGGARSGTVSIAGQTFTVDQGAAPCSYSIAPTAASVAAGASTGSVTVTAHSGCAWTAASQVPWITVTSGAAGNGNGSVAYSVGENTDTASRTGTITVEGQILSVTQAGATPPPPPCTFSIAPDAQSMASSGGAATVTITTGASCAWTAAGNIDWLTVSPPSGTGGGSVTVTAAANPGAERTPPQSPVRFSLSPSLPLLRHHSDGISIAL
jgi:hypothetical protein